MKHSIFIDGGIGRVITAIPALEKFVETHPEDEIRIFVAGWEQVFWNNRILQPLAYPVQQKGNWDYIRTSKRWFPEPYHHQGYIDGTSHLIDAFADLLEVQIDNRIPNLYVWSQEHTKIEVLLEQYKKQTTRKKVVVFQPYGTGMKLEGSKPTDSGGRSLDVDQYLAIAKNLAQDHTIVFLGQKEFEHPGDNFSLKISQFNPDIRFMIALIEQADYFIGIDSVGQHIAHSLKIPGTVIMGSTRESNVSYSDHFNIIRKPNTEPVYVPIRFPLMEVEYAERLNDNILNFSNDEIKKIIDNIRAHIKKTVK